METELSIFLGILAVFLLLFLTVVSLLVYSGLFTPVEIGAGKPPFDQLVVAYKFNRGPYKNAGELFTQVHSLVPTLRTIGIYYDDPYEVQESALRCIVGAIVDEEKKEEHQKLLLDNGYKVMELPAVSHAVTTTFPFKNTLSIFIAMAKVYPRLNDFIKSRSLYAHPMIEVYDKETILFVAPLAKQDEFYVPELLEENSDEERCADKDTNEVATKESLSETKKKPQTGLQLDEKKNNLEPDTLSPTKSENGSDSAGSSFEELNMDS